MTGNHNYSPGNIALLMALMFLSHSCSKENDPGIPKGPLVQAEERMKAYVDQGKLPFVSTLVARDGEVVHQFVYGMADIAAGIPADEQTLFRIYSMSKPVTTAALMILFDEGRFELDDPVEDHIPLFEGMKVWEDGREVDQVEPFTIRNLLTHTAGFTYGWENTHVDSIYASLFASSLLIKGSYTLEEFAIMLSEIPLKHQPGTTYEYSISIDVAGYLVEVLSGMALDSFMQERLFGPLGMEDTGFNVEEADYDRQAMIYASFGGNLAPVTYMSEGVRGEIVFFSGGGGLVSTAGDYARFAQMLLNGGELEGTRVLKESTVDLIMSDQMPEAVDYEGGYGLGGFVHPENGAYGWNGAASTTFIAYQDNDLAVLTFTQLTPSDNTYAEDYRSLILPEFQ